MKSDLTIDCPVEIDGTATTLLVKFEYQIDRWQQSWFVESAGHSIPLMSSLEGTDDDRFPTCPPIQDLHEHQLADTNRRDRAVVLGVGMAGKGHWSASISWEHSSQAMLRNDYACLMKDDTNGWLGSTFQVDSNWDIAALDAEQLQMQHPDLEDLVVLLKCDPICLVSIDRADDELARVRVEPKECSTVKHTATRWIFDIWLGSR